MLIEKLYIRMSVLKSPRFLYKIFRYFRKFFGEKNPGNLPFNFDNEPNRIDIIQSIINIKIILHISKLELIKMRSSPK